MNLIRWYKLETTKVNTVSDLVSLCQTPQELGYWLKRNIKYVSDEVKHKVKDYWQTPEETAECRTGDCLLGDTPLIVSRGGRSEILEICELMPSETAINEKFAPKGLFVLTGHQKLAKSSSMKFQRINWVLKKNTDKDIYRIRSGKSVIDVTEDHKILCRENGKHEFFEANRLAKNKKRIRVVKNLSSSFSAFGVSYGLGYVYGLFVAEGHSSEKGWNICNTDISLLERAKSFLEKERMFNLRPLKYEIVLYDCFRKGRDTNLSTRTMDLFILKPKMKHGKGSKKSRGSIVKFSTEWRKRCYTRLKNKKVPSCIMNGSEEAKQGFLDGFYDGDKNCTVSKILAFGLVVLNECLGKRVYIHDGGNNFEVVDKKGDIRRLLKNSKHIGKTTKNVYDLNVDSPHTFCAGDIRVHNCEDYAILAKAWGDAKGYDSKIMVYTYKDKVKDAWVTKAHAICNVDIESVEFELSVDGCHELGRGPFFKKKNRIFLWNQEYSVDGKPIG